MTSAAVRKFATVEPTLCAACRRRAVWLGYMPGQRQAAFWLCGDAGCIAASRKVYDMPMKLLDAYEEKARQEAPDAAGAYLAEIGQSDVGKLTLAQWQEFGRRLIVGYEQSLRRILL